MSNCALRSPNVIRTRGKPVSETATTTLTDFLLARIAEDEEHARSATVPRALWPRVVEGVAEHDDAAGWHVLHWDPARVLTECEAKRQIVALHARAQGHWSQCVICGTDPGTYDSLPTDWPCPTL